MPPTNRTETPLTQTVTVAGTEYSRVDLLPKCSGVEETPHRITSQYYVTDKVNTFCMAHLPADVPLSKDGCGVKSYCEEIIDLYDLMGDASDESDEEAVKAFETEVLRGIREKMTTNTEAEDLLTKMGRPRDAAIVKGLVWLMEQRDDWFAYEKDFLEDNPGWGMFERYEPETSTERPVSELQEQALSGLKRWAEERYYLPKLEDDLLTDPPLWTFRMGSAPDYKYAIEENPRWDVYTSGTCARRDCWLRSKTFQQTTNITCFTDGTEHFHINCGVSADLSDTFRTWATSLARGDARGTRRA